MFAVLETLIVLIVGMLIIALCYYFCCRGEEAPKIYCYVCNTQVTMDTWDMHRQSQCPDKSKLYLLETSPYGKCGKCQGGLKLMKR